MDNFDGKSFSFKDLIKNLTRDFSNFLIWEEILPNFFKKNKNINILEIGCAPGKYLYKMKELFEYQPFGVDYSEKGVLITREFFIKKGLNPENIIQADIFDSNFQNKNKEKFDIVFSRGFIEHFDNVSGVIDIHADLLKKDGLMFIMIPNLQGLNSVFSRFLNIDSFILHNLNIMNKNNFSALFPKDKFEILFLDYIGIFSFGLFNTNKKWKYILYRILLLIQRPFDFLFRILYRSGINFSCKYSSPYILFIGIKK
jgi:SAM-dependent methyltransferase